MFHTVSIRFLPTTIRRLIWSVSSSRAMLPIFVTCSRTPMLSSCGCHTLRKKLSREIPVGIETRTKLAPARLHVVPRDRRARRLPDQSIVQLVLDPVADENRQLRQYLLKCVARLRTPLGVVLISRFTEAERRRRSGRLTRQPAPPLGSGLRLVDLAFRIENDAVHQLRRAARHEPELDIGSN